MTSRRIRVPESDYKFIKKIAEEDLEDNSRENIKKGMTLVSFYAREGRKMLKGKKSGGKKKKKYDLF